MAIIKIPSSIGGVSIPGITNVPGGPLGVLFGNGKKLNTLQYPRDLGSGTKGHIVQFSINTIQPTQFSETNVGKILPNVMNGELAAASSNVLGAIKDGANEFKNIVLSAKGKYSEGETFQVALNARKKTQTASISLYMPDTISSQYSVDYQKTSLLNIATGLVDKISPVSTSQIVGSDITKLGLASQGLAINDQQQIYFERIDFRTFELAFIFTPYSRDETEQIKSIVKMFKYHSAPEIVKGGAGLFFVPPSTFNIKFMHNGEENQYINKVEECVIENIDVNYTPNGWSAHPDGSPTQINLTMRFKELSLIDKNKIANGY